jgi:hypothetical protein
MPGFLEVYGYYSPELKAWNIDVYLTPNIINEFILKPLQPTVQQLISSLMVSSFRCPRFPDQTISRVVSFPQEPHSSSHGRGIASTQNLENLAN